MPDGGYCPTCGRPLPPTLTCARLERGWSMRTLARHAGVQVSTVSRVEAGREPSLDAAFRLSTALDVPVDVLFRAYRDRLAMEKLGDAAGGMP